MNEVAIGFGSLLCRGAIWVGVGGLHCYQQVPLQMLGWSAAAVFFIVVVLTTKWLGKSAG